MQLVATRWGSVATSITGRGTPLILLHSGGHDHHDFDAVASALARHHTVVAMDLPGHGGSEMFDPPESASAERICEGVLDAIDALALGPAVLVGNSVGGMAAIYAAAKRQEAVRGLVLVSSSGLVRQHALLRALCWLQGRPWTRRTTGMAFARFYMKRRTPEVAAILARMEEARGRPEFIAMEAALWRSFGAPTSDLSGLAPSIVCPSLFVWGTQDPVLRASVEGRRARSFIAHARWVEMSCGHVPFAEDPEGFLAAVEPFLRELCGDDATSTAAPASSAPAPSHAAPGAARGAPP
jgi:pimeloyl-ACP methyl ester carboxylesterase